MSYLTYTQMFKELVQESEKIEKKRLNSLPFQLTPAKLDEKYKKKYNIGSNDVYYNITKNGVKVCDGLFRNYITDCTENLNKDRFVVLNVCLEDVYSDDIVKTCNLKSKHCLSCFTCVFDTELCKIAYLCDERFDSSITLHKNVVVDNRKNKVVWLPTGDVLVELKKESFKSLNVNKVGNFLFVSDCKYSDGTFMKRINIETGENLGCL
ncbi:MAG: hypothetical protein IKO56_01485 [Alphaproteobacteria bacterium]|nr:hypothetical protein [Alphaproteobacteria bacterium]